MTNKQPTVVFKRISLKSTGVSNRGMVATIYVYIFLDVIFKRRKKKSTGDAEKEECGGSGVRCFGTVSGVFWN